jgi:hypothetical protein
MYILRRPESRRRGDSGNAPTGNTYNIINSHVEQLTDSGQNHKPNHD